MATYPVDLLRAEGVLEDFEVGDELVFMLGVHLDADHGDIAYPSGVKAGTVTNVQARG